MSMPHSLNITRDMRFLCRMPDCSSPARRAADLCESCSVDELRAQHRLMRETLETLAAHLMTEIPEESATPSLPVGVREQIDELVKAGIVRRPPVIAQPTYDDCSSSGVYEVFEDEPTSIILADLEHLARKLEAA